jgi:pyruvate/2-oxoglutarate dehydrogenase complex dihydrolipoamide acyltransferase (E2) component
MEREKITISSPVAIAGTTFILVIKLSLKCQGAGSNIFFSGIKQPVNVVVASPSTKKAFNIDGDEIPIDPLLQEVPDLAGMLEKT